MPATPESILEQFADSIPSMRAAAVREAAMRRTVYHRRVLGGNMTAQKADSEILAMDQIADLLSQLDELQRGVQELDLGL